MSRKTLPEDPRRPVIVPCWNELSFTRLCLAALFRHTRQPFALIVIDNGSNDGTAAYLAGVGDAAPALDVVITNPVNLGFPAAVNQGCTTWPGDGGRRPAGNGSRGENGETRN